MVLDAPRCDVDRTSASIFDPGEPADEPGEVPDGDLGLVQRDGNRTGFRIEEPLGPGTAPFIGNQLLGEMSPEPARHNTLVGKIAVVAERPATGDGLGAWSACGVFEAR